MQDTQELTDLPDAEDATTIGTDFSQAENDILESLDGFDGGFEDDEDDDTTEGTDSTAIDADSQEDQEEDGDLDAFADVSDSKGMHSLRDAYKRSQKELKDLQSRLKDLESTAQPTAQPAPVPTNEADKFAEQYTATDILEFLGRYEAGEAEGDPAALLKLRGVALEALERKTPAEVLDVLRKAQRGEFGDISRDVQAIAAESLATLAVVGETRKAEQQAKTNWQSERQQSLAEVLKIEGIRAADGSINTQSETGKQYIAAGKELLSLIPEVQNYATAPQVVLTYMQLKQKSDAHDALSKENQELKARLRRFGGSLPSGKPNTKSSKADSAEATLREEFSALGYGS